jgi:enoyl-CoA hydratase/carnithine racemase
MFTAQMCHEIRDCINDVRARTRTRVLVITGAGDKFFCIGGPQGRARGQHALRRHAADARNL